jgi:hypothetical protein
MTLVEKMRLIRRRCGDNTLVRAIFFAGAAIIVFNLFWLGAKPVAVGLFPEPLDKVAHFSTYGLIAAFLWLSFFRRHPWRVIALVTAVGAADEFHQIFLPGRSAGLDDLAADFLAAVTVVSLLAYVDRRGW